MKHGREDRHQRLKSELAGRLAGGARAYLEPALKRFHAAAKTDDAELQAILGNVAVGIELLLKAFLASRSPALAFKDLSPEARVALQSPESVPDGYNWRPLELDLRDFAYDTIPFDEAVRAFYVFFPESKQALRPHFRLVSELRKLALESSPGEMQPHEIERPVYLALHVAALVAPFLGSLASIEGDKEKQFLRRFDAERVVRVEASLERAKEKAKTLKVDIQYNDPGLRESWDAFEGRCPVCKNWGLLSGATDIRCEPLASPAGRRDAGGDHETLEFTADSYACDACGLVLEDAEEMRLADMPLAYDRTEDLERWRDDGAEPKTN